MRNYETCERQTFYSGNSNNFTSSGYYKKTYQSNASNIEYHGIQKNKKYIYKKRNIRTAKEVSSTPMIATTLWNAINANQVELAQIPHNNTIECWKNCAWWELKLNTSTNQNQKMGTNTMFGILTNQLKATDLPVINLLPKDLSQFYPIDLRQNQRFALDKNQPKIPLLISFNCLGRESDSNNYSNISKISKDYSSLLFDISINASLHNQPRTIFKSDINFTVKGYDIWKSIQTRLTALSSGKGKSVTSSTNTKSNDVISSKDEYSVTVFNNIQCSFAVTFNISRDNLMKYFEATYHNNYSLGSYYITITQISINYNLPLIVFKPQECGFLSINNCANTNTMMINSTCPSNNFYTLPYRPLFCNWQSFMSNTTPVLTETDNLRLINIFKCFSKSSLFGIGCLYKIDSQHYTKVNYFPTWGCISLHYKQENPTVPATSNAQTQTPTYTHSNKNNNNNNDNSTLDGSFITSISSTYQDDKNNVSTEVSEKEEYPCKIIFSEISKETYKVKSYLTQLRNITKENKELFHWGLKDISSSSYFSIIWSPNKTAQPNPVKGSKYYTIKYVENDNFPVFEVFYQFRKSENVNNTSKYLNVIGILQKDIKGRLVDLSTSSTPLFDYFWFMNKAMHANSYFFEQDLLQNKLLFCSLSDFAKNHWIIM